ncbi:MAG: DUF3619 family protein [Rubrivivax sp.]|nr:DUF3619 family protein [Rubrivivax sp.]
MNMDSNDLPATELELLETRLSARLAAALSGPAGQLPWGAEERLRFAREQALEVARRRRASALVAGAGGVGVLGGLAAWWPRLAALLPVIVLAAGAILLSQSREREQVAVAGEIDVALLADDLPPAAYADPGFAAFLKLQQP